jgi:hypothetical protein
MMRRLAWPVLLALWSAVAWTSGAAAQGEYTGVPIVHREAVQVGSYGLTVGLSEWPIRSQRSLDIVFMPDGGIDGKGGTVTLVAPSGEEWARRRLVRHPRMRSAWGLDVIALPEQGRWTWRFEVDGPAGRGEGSIPVTVEERPGPPVLAGWLPIVLAAGTLTVLIAFAWRRVRPAQRPESSSWQVVSGE